MELSTGRVRKIVINAIHRRNTIINPEILRGSFELYNGYDFFTQTLDKNFLGVNLAELVTTRELTVTHKVKVSKGAKKNQMLKARKKIPVDKRGAIAKKAASKTTKKK
jgi:ribosomal protein S19